MNSASEPAKRRSTIWTTCSRFGAEASSPASEHRPPEDKDYKTYFAERLLNQTEIFSFTCAETPDGKVVGWISLAPFRSNPAVKGVMAEMSAYVDPEHVATGITGFAVKSVLQKADASPLQYIVAFTLETNDGVLQLCKRFGFKLVGTYPVSPQGAGCDAAGVSRPPLRLPGVGRSTGSARNAAS